MGLWERSVLVFALAAGCGSVNGSPDGRPIDAPPGTPDSRPVDAAPPRCNPSAPFGTPMAMSSINTGSSDEAPHLSPDELTIYFSSNRAGGLGGYDLYEATRADQGTMFGTATAIPGVNTAKSERAPSVTADGLTLYAYSASPNGDLLVANRSSTQASFGPLTALTQPNSSGNDSDPYILPDGSAIYFTSDRNGSNQIFRASRNATGFDAPSMVTGADIPSTSDATAVASADELVLYFSSSRVGGAGGYDIWRASRASTADGFGAAVNLSVLNTAASDWPSWISADDCVLYFFRDDTGQGNSYDMFVTMRGQ